jgi:outer membrane lipoprotein-sorting protein
MKKYLFILVGALVMVLAGCGTTLSKEEVVTNAINAEINSVEVEGTVDVEIDSNGQSMTQSLELVVKFIQEPFITYVQMSTVDGDVEIYSDKDHTYMLVPDMEEWLKTSTSDTPGISDLAGGQSIKEDLERLKKFNDLFTFESVEEGYVLKVTLTEEASEDELALVKEILKESVEDVEFEDVRINSFDYVLTIDKEFLLNSTVAKLDLEVTAEGEEASIVTSADVNYTNVNNVKEFSVPAEVVETAVEY